jgi:hypothetical protein
MGLEGFSLDPIIREASKRVRHEPKDSTLVRVACAATRKMWELPHKKYYLVNHDGTQRTNAEGTIDLTLEDFAESLRLNLSVRCRVRCQRENAEKAANALGAGEDSPTDRFEKLMQEWANNYASAAATGSEVIVDFYRHRGKLAGDLKRRAKEQTGLDLEPLVELKTKGIKNPQTVETFQISLFLSDYPKPLKVAVGQMSLFLHHDPRHEIQAHIRYDRWQEVEQQIRRRIEDFAHDSITLEKLRAPGPDLSREVHQDLNLMLAEYGRELRAGPVLRAAEALPVPEPGGDLEVSVNNRIIDYPNPVMWKCEMHLQLVDLAKSASGPLVRLSEWKEAVVPALIRKHIADKTYTQLFEELHGIKDSIRTELGREAGKLGYGVVQFALSTNLPFDRLRDSVLIRAEGEFATSEAELKVKVSVEGRVRISNLHKVAELLNSGHEVEPKMQEEIGESLKQAVRACSPEHIYLYFDRPKEDARNGVELLPFRDMVLKRVSSLLTDLYGAKVLSLDCTRDGSLLDKLRELENKDRSLSATITRAGITVNITYHLLRVWPGWWHRFQATQPDGKALDTSIGRYVTQIFADSEGTDFRKEPNSYWQRRLGDWDNPQSLSCFIRNYYGLAIQLVEWRRELTAAEQKELAATAATELAIAESQSAGIEDFTGASKTMFENRKQNRESLLAQIAILNRRIAALDPTDTGEAKELEDLVRAKDRLTRQLEETSAGNLLDTLKPVIAEKQRKLERALQPGERVDEVSRKLLAPPPDDPPKVVRAASGGSVPYEAEQVDPDGQ